MAKDESYLYLMILLWDGPPVVDEATNYSFTATETYGTGSDGDFGTYVATGDGGVRFVKGGINDSPTEYPSDYAGIGSNFVEWKVPLPEVENINGKYVHVQIHVWNDCSECEEWGVNDDTYYETQLQLQ